MKTITISEEVRGIIINALSVRLGLLEKTIRQLNELETDTTTTGEQVKATKVLIDYLTSNNPNEFLYGFKRFLPAGKMRTPDKDKWTDEEWKIQASLRCDDSITPAGYAMSDFYDAAKSDADLFFCIDNDRIYMPGEKGLFTSDELERKLRQDATEQQEINVDIEKAIQYVRDNKSWSDAQEQSALKKINELRCDISYADSNIADEIAELMNEYGEENEFPEGWWEEEMSVDDIFFKL